MRSILPLLVLLAAFAAAAARADPELDALFQDHAVLQRDKPVPVWGRASPGEHVSVAFGGQTVGATADADGRWIVVLSAMPANSAGTELTVAGKRSVAARDVLVGEVWLCSGGSGMELEVDASRPSPPRTGDAAAEVAAARYPLIRQFKVAPQSPWTRSVATGRSARPRQRGDSRRSAISLRAISSRGSTCPSGSSTARGPGLRSSRG
jgi:sialate O-acetylesterase